MWLVLRRMPDRSRRSLTSPSRGLEEPILPILPILISEQHKNLQSHVLKMNCQHDLTLGRPWPDHYVGVNKRFLTDLFASMLAQAEGFTSSSEPPSPRATVARGATRRGALPSEQFEFHLESTTSGSPRFKVRNLRVEFLS